VEGFYTIIDGSATMKNKYKIQREWLLFLVGLVLASRIGYRIWRLIEVRQIVSQARLRTQEAYRENKLLRKRLAEVSSDAFVEREARDKLGMGKEGETILILPDQNLNPKSQVPNPNENKPNWRKWWELYVRL